MNTPNILILYTGGTIGMVQDTETGSLKVFDFKNIYDQIPRLAFYNIKVDTFAFQHPIDSSDMNPSDWADIGNKIMEYYDQYDGFVVLHGTDTMGYTASALSFMFNHLNKPIILTGSQLPLGIARTDGRNNMINSIELAAARNENGLPMIPEVCICFENKLYRGNRTHKNHAENFDAFASPNYPILAHAGVSIKYNKEYIHQADGLPVELFTDMDANISILKLFPGITPSVVKSVLHAEGLKGVILETYGSGNACQSPWFLNLLREAVDKGIAIVNVTQCKGGGSVDLGKYETSLELQKMGIISGYDIITESAVTKLMYLLGKEKNIDRIKYLFNKSLRGEISIE